MIAMFELIEPSNKDAITQWKNAENQRGNNISLDEQIDQAMAFEMTMSHSLKSPRRVNVKTIEMSIVTSGDTAHTYLTSIRDPKTDRFKQTLPSRPREDSPGNRQSISEFYKGI